MGISFNVFLMHFFVARQPKKSAGRLIVEVPKSHTHTHTHTPHTHTIHTHTHTHTVGLLRRSGQLVAEAVTYTTQQTYLLTYFLTYSMEQSPS
jgi:hypothetical protein